MPARIFPSDAKLLPDKYKTNVGDSIIVLGLSIATLDAGTAVFLHRLQGVLVRMKRVGALKGIYIIS